MTEVYNWKDAYVIKDKEDLTKILTELHSDDIELYYAYTGKVMILYNCHLK